jgi:hypothetical protein
MTTKLGEKKNKPRKKNFKWKTASKGQMYILSLYSNNWNFIKLKFHILYSDY